MAVRPSNSEHAARTRGTEMYTTNDRLVVSIFFIPPHKFIPPQFPLLQWFHLLPNGKFSTDGIVILIQNQ